MSRVPEFGCLVVAYFAMGILHPWWRTAIVVLAVSTYGYFCYERGIKSTGGVA